MLLYYTLCVIDHDHGEDMTEILRTVGVHALLSAPAKGTARSEHLSLYDLEAKEKVMMTAVSDGEQLKQIFKLAQRRLYIDVPGHGIIMAVPMKSVGGKRTLSYLTDSRRTGGKPDMEFAYELIIVVMNEGQSDFVMDAARNAGARGGTVLHAKSGGSRRPEDFFGVTLTTEKDVLYIATLAERKEAIMKAIMDTAGPETRAGAYCYSLPISAVAGMRMGNED